MWSPSGLPEVSEMSSPYCFPELSFTFPSCLPELVFQLSPSVFHLSPSCPSDVVSDLSCLSYKCGLPIVSQLSSTCLPQLLVVSQMPPYDSPIAFHLFHSCLQMWSKCLQIVYLILAVLALNLKPSRLLGCKAGPCEGGHRLLARNLMISSLASSFTSNRAISFCT
jgi:hypothetical protein